MKERIIKFIKYLGLTQKAFLNSIGVSESYLAAMRKAASPDVIRSIASIYPQLSIDWLITGEGPMLRDETSTTINAPVTNSNVAGANFGHMIVGGIKKAVESIPTGCGCEGKVNIFEAIIAEKDKEILRQRVEIETLKQMLNSQSREGE